MDTAETIRIKNKWTKQGNTIGSDLRDAGISAQLMADLQAHIAEGMYMAFVGGCNSDQGAGDVVSQALDYSFFQKMPEISEVEEKVGGVHDPFMGDKSIRDETGRIVGRRK